MKEETKRYYYDTGEKRCIEPWVNGKPHGIMKYYYITGELNIETPYKNGVLDGTWISYKTDGSIIKTMYYEDGLSVKKLMKDKYLDFFLWFRDNGEKYIGYSAEAMIKIYMNENGEL